MNPDTSGTPDTIRRTHREIGENMVELIAAVVALVKEALAVVRAAMVDWSLTARLCVILIVVAATISTTASVLR